MCGQHACEECAICHTGVVNAELTTYRYLEGGSPDGSTEYLDTINLASTQCPDTKIVLGGYSQGGQILHNAAEKLTAAVTAKIAAG